MTKAIAGAVALLLGLALWTSGPSSARQDEPDGSLVVVTHVDVMPKFTAEGRELLRGFAAASRKDEGAVRVEVFEEIGRPNHSTVVEAWKARKAYDDHLAADHVRSYRAKLQPMLGSPFDERLHREVR
jgi:quinol monooxygenase YgiN